MEHSPFLTARAAFLRDVDKSEGWYRKHVNNPLYDPPLPKTVKQGTTNKTAYVVTEHANAYKRALLLKAGIPVVGRPRKDKTIAAAGN
jgi:hypothetical protein